MINQWILVVIFMFTALERVNAACVQNQREAQKACDKANVRDPLLTFKEMQPYLAKSNATVPGVEKAVVDVNGAKAQVDQAKLKCAQKIDSCIKVCEGEANERYANNDAAGGRSAEEARNYCAYGEPAENQKAMEAASINMEQLLPGLLQLLATLKGDGGESGALCTRDPNNPQCRTDVAAQSNMQPLTETQRSTATDGTFLDAGVNGNDVPGQGERTDPSLAQGMPGIGGMAGINAAALAGGGGGRSRGVAEGNVENGPKVPLSTAMGGGGGPKSTSPLGGGSLSPKAGGGNPVASRTSIDGDSKNNGSSAMDRALQARGLASEDGAQAGGVSAAHSFDNFQKIEKRIQAERNRLSEL